VCKRERLLGYPFSPKQSTPTLLSERQTAKKLVVFIATKVWRKRKKEDPQLNPKREIVKENL
jgi:hypothetical protein